MLLTINRISKSFDGGKSYALHDVSFGMKKGDVSAIVGESGSGKTTLVRLIAGLERPDSGEITFRDEIVSSVQRLVPPEKRKIGLVFQEYALFPHLTVLDNVLYGISRRKNKKQRAREMLELVDLKEVEKRYPHQLSGGQRQRVALARALAPNPDLLILDEPFSNLDVVLRAQLRNQVFQIIKKTGVTAIFVTHDTQDALTVADEILILQEGSLIQKDQAFRLYTQPKSIYVASLFGNTVLLDKALQTAFKCPLKPGCCHAIRHENITINTECEYVTNAKVLKSTFLGNNTELLIQLENGHQMTVLTQEDNIEENIRIGFNSHDVMEFSH